MRYRPCLFQISMGNPMADLANPQSDDAPLDTSKRSAAPADAAVQLPEGQGDSFANAMEHATDAPRYGNPN